MPIQSLAAVQDARMLTASVFKMTLISPELARSAKPGQFVHIKCGEGSLLRRPISVCDAAGDMLTIVFERKGAGTQYLSERSEGDTLDVLGPLGNGFDIREGRYLLVGGGIGVPPLLYAAKSAKGADAVLGFRTKDAVILEDAYKAVCGEVAVTTDDGSYGLHGTVAAPVRERLEKGEYAGVLACGPRAMLRAVAEVCKEYNVPCQVSMEERMGCGVGACLVCVCQTEKDGERAMRRVCKDGPVFWAEEVSW